MHRLSLRGPRDDTNSRKEDCIAKKNEGASKKAEETLVCICEI